METVVCTSLYFGTINGAGTALLMRVPAAGGGITILDAKICTLGLGTIAAAFQLVQMTDAATPVVDGTIGTAAVPGTASVGSPLSTTLVSPYVSAGKWLGLKTGAASNFTADGYAVISYVMGK